MAYGRIMGTLIACGMIGLPAAVLADIGGVGSPVVPSNGPTGGMGSSSVVATPPVNYAQQPPATMPQQAYPGMPSAGYTQAAPRSAAARNVPNQEPLMIIRFNQPRVYYQHSLEQAVGMSYRNKPDVTFDVVSSVPAVVSQTERAHINHMAERNLQEVIQTIESQGVPAARIHGSSQPSADITSQEIRIYVN